MACGCTLYECLEVVQQFNSCPSVVELRLEATETTTYQWLYEFNGGWKGGTVDVTEGENIVLPWVFNEYYIHKIQFLASGELVNDTCYKLDTSKIAGSYQPPSEGDESNYLTFIVTEEMLSDGGATVTYSGIAGRTPVFVVSENQIWNSSNFTTGEDEFTMTNETTFYAGQSISLIF